MPGLGALATTVSWPTDLLGRLLQLRSWKELGEPIYAPDGSAIRPTSVVGVSTTSRPSSSTGVDRSIGSACRIHVNPFTKDLGKAVDLVRGIGRCAGLEIIEVPGMVGL